MAVQEAPLDAVVPTFASFGAPTKVGALYRGMFEAIASGHVAFEGGHRRVQGATPAEAALRVLLGRAATPA